MTAGVNKLVCSSCWYMQQCERHIAVILIIWYLLLTWSVFFVDNLVAGLNAFNEPTCHLFKTFNVLTSTTFCCKHTLQSLFSLPSSTLEFRGTFFIPAAWILKPNIQFSCCTLVTKYCFMPVLFIYAYCGNNFVIYKKKTHFPCPEAYWIYAMDGASPIILIDQLTLDYLEQIHNHAFLRFKP